MKRVPDMAPMDLTVDAWLKELAESTRKNDAGYTAKEVAEVLGVSLLAARHMIGHAVAAGRVEVGSRTITRIDGKPSRAPVYRFVKKGAGK